MRLRKNMKRTAAAVLALSMAVSAVAAPASAAYICDVSQGSVEVSVNEKGEKTINHFKCFLDMSGKTSAVFHVIDGGVDLRQGLDALVPPGSDNGLRIGNTGFVDGFAVEQDGQNDVTANVVIIMHPDEGFLFNMAQRSAQLLFRQLEQGFQILGRLQSGGNFCRTEFAAFGTG